MPWLWRSSVSDLRRVVSPCLLHLFHTPRTSTRLVLHVHCKIKKQWPTKKKNPRFIFHCASRKNAFKLTFFKIKIISTFNTVVIHHTWHITKRMQTITVKMIIQPIRTSVMLSIWPKKMISYNHVQPKISFADLHGVNFQWNYEC